MKTFIKKIIRCLLAPFVLTNYARFNMLDKTKRFSNDLGDLNPQIFDKTFKTRFDRHYVYHTAWAVRKVKQIAPEFHTDISSSLYFSGMLSAFVPVKFYDYRPADLELGNLECGKADLRKLPFPEGSLKSLSCMHTIEHIGLGRYGDAINPDGDLLAIAELKRVLAPGGDLLVVVPVGKPRIEYNAHRIYSYEQIIDYFKGLDLAEFVLIPEASGGLIKGASAARVAQETYACGCFWFKKKI
jgi:SAM-dependent methyltransferase